MNSKMGPRSMGPSIPPGLVQMLLLEPLLELLLLLLHVFN